MFPIDFSNRTWTVIAAVAVIAGLSLGLLVSWKAAIIAVAVIIGAPIALMILGVMLWVASGGR